MDTKKLEEVAKELAVVLHLSDDDFSDNIMDY